MIGKFKYRFGEAKAAFRTGGFADGLNTLVRRFNSDVYGAERRLYARTRSRNGVVVLPIQGSLMALRLDDPGLSRVLIRDGIREREHTQLIHEEIHPGMVGVDLGANLGYYALMEARIVGPKGKVFAVEPVPHNVAVLQRNVELNHYTNMEVHQMAISDECGEAEMWITPQSNFCNLLSETDEALRPEIRQTHAGEQSAHRIKVPTMTLDRFLEVRGVKSLNFIRMDIEGFEVRVTKGMQKTLTEARGVLKLFVEVHNAHFTDPMATVGAWLQELLNLGFQPKALAIAGRPEGIIRIVSAKDFPALVCQFRECCPHVLLVKNG